MEFTRKVQAACTSFACLFVIGVFSAPAFAQKITGDISGTVTDAAGAALPGAAVSAECTTTKLTRSVSSGGAGEFRLAEMPICIYKVSVGMPGFKTSAREVQVVVSGLTKSDFRLEVGARTEEVIVEATAPQVEFSDKLNSYVDAARIEDLPLNGRDFNSLVGIVPGVQRAPGGGFLAININGARTTSNNFMVDGISNNDRYYGGIAVGETGVVGLPATVVPPDAIAEFTVQQTPGAEFGVKGGAAINIVMKSGSNQVHGSTYYYRHDDWMDAKNYFTEKDGGPKTSLKNQQFGATLGGPIVKDKTFFFAYYEGQRLSVGTPYRVTVPTPQNIADARARLAAAGLATTTAGENLLSFYPTHPSGQITVNAPNDGKSDNLSLKLDHKLNSSNQLSARVFYGDSFQSAPAGTTTLVPAAPNPSDLFNSITSPTVKLIGATWTSTLASNKILETRVGYNSFSQLLGINNKIDPKSLGIDTGPLDPGDFGVPYVDYFSYFGYIGGIGGYPITTAPNATLDIGSNLTWIKDKHAVKVGVSYQHSTTFSIRNRARTTLEATGTGASLDQVDSIVELLLGKFDFAGRTFGDTTRHLTQNSIGGFVNDDWKLTPRLTLNLGVRYDVNLPLGERDNKVANFIPDRGLVQVGQGIDKLYNTDWSNIGPRLGFAWDVNGDGKTALRGGYSLTYDVANFAAIHAPYTINGARIGAFTEPNLGVFGVALAGDASVPPDDPAATCVDPVTGAGDYICVGNGQPIFGSSPTGFPPFNAFSVPQDLKTPKSHIYHLTFQRELFKNNVATLSYVGQRGSNNFFMHDLNAPPIGSDPFDVQPNRPFNTQYPGLKHIVQITNDSKTWYDSLQVSWRQANWKGLNTQYNFTWSKCIDYSSVNRGGAGEAGQFQNPYNPAGNKGPCDYDIPYNFNAAGVYKAPDLGGGVVGSGWELATVFTALSGRPFTAHTNRDRSGQDFDRVRANCLADVQYNPRDPDNYIANAAEAFGVPANGTVGTCGRNTIRGPGFAQWDLSLIKTTKINERFKLQLRWEVFNLLNRGNFSGDSATFNVRSGSFAQIQSTPDVYVLNPVLAQGGPRAMQWAVKLLF